MSGSKQKPMVLKGLSSGGYDELACMRAEFLEALKDDCLVLLGEGVPIRHDEKKNVVRIGRLGCLRKRVDRNGRRKMSADFARNEFPFDSILAGVASGNLTPSDVLSRLDGALFRGLAPALLMPSWRLRRYLLGPEVGVIQDVLGSLNEEAVRYGPFGDLRWCRPSAWSDTYDLVVRGAGLADLQPINAGVSSYFSLAKELELQKSLFRDSDRCALLTKTIDSLVADYDFLMPRSRAVARKIVRHHRRLTWSRLLEEIKRYLRQPPVGKTAVVRKSQGSARASRAHGDVLKDKNVIRISIEARVDPLFVAGLVREIGADGKLSRNGWRVLRCMVASPEGLAGTCAFTDWIGAKFGKYGIHGLSNKWKRIDSTRSIRALLGADGDLVSMAYRITLKQTFDCETGNMLYRYLDAYRVLNRDAPRLFPFFRVAVLDLIKHQSAGKRAPLLKSFANSLESSPQDVAKILASHFAAQGVSSSLWKALCKLDAATLSEMMSLFSRKSHVAPVLIALASFVLRKNGRLDGRGFLLASSVFDSAMGFGGVWDYLNPIRKSAVRKIFVHDLQLRVSGLFHCLYVRVQKLAVEDRSFAKELRSRRRDLDSMVMDIEASCEERVSLAQQRFLRTWRELRLIHDALSRTLEGVNVQIERAGQEEVLRVLEVLPGPGASWSAWVEFQRQWHIREEDRVRQEFLARAKAGEEPQVHWPCALVRYTDGSLGARVLCDSHALLDEAARMHHCVHGYGEACVKQSVRVASILDDGRHVATVAIYPVIERNGQEHTAEGDHYALSMSPALLEAAHFVMLECAGAWNAAVPSRIVAFARRFMQAYEQAWREACAEASRQRRAA